jgi:MoxR-like ATPase
MKQHYFLTREKELVPVELTTETAYKRQIKIGKGEKAKVRNIHPQGVAWGTMYPRLFYTENKPEHIFVHKGRTLVQTHPDKNSGAIPHTENYRFQPFITDVIDSIHAKENVLLTGGTGVGKTTHILQLAGRIRQPVLRINFNGETRMSDLIGKVSVIGGETVWVDGVLPSAMRKGYWLLLDELDFADPAVLSLLHPVLEDDAQLVLKENGGEIIRPHENFRVFATANSIGAMQDRAGAYGGTNTMNEAFLDRWQVILVDNLPEKEEIMVVRSKVKGLTNVLAKRIVQFANKARNQNFDDGFQFSGDNFSTRKVLAWAKKTALHRNAILGAKLAWLDKMPQSEQDVVMRMLSTHFGTRSRKTKTKLKILTNPTSVAAPKKRGRKTGT